MEFIMDIEDFNIIICIRRELLNLFFRTPINFEHNKVLCIENESYE